MEETWSLLNNGVLQRMHGLHDPPTYEEYLFLCWDFINRQAREEAKNRITGKFDKAAR